MGAAGKRVAIVQSSYIPWKGYFDLIRGVDEFILLDDVQYTKRDWRNRNRIKMRSGVQWLTIPVEVKGRRQQTIWQTRIADPGWNDRHWQTLCLAYRRAPHFGRYAEWLEALYSTATDRSLSRVNRHFIEAICGMLGIRTVLRWSSDYRPAPGRSQRLLSLCQQAGASQYLSGPAARGYLDEELFASAGIEVQWMNYEGYPEYEQLHPPFRHDVTILDLLVHTGDQAAAHLLSA